MTTNFRSGSGEYSSDVPDCFRASIRTFELDAFRITSHLRLATPWAIGGWVNAR
jgi:hypothetical protein